MCSDEQLIRRINKKQDKAAAEELVQRYYKEIYGYVYRQIGDRETAMDLTQDIFVAVLRALHTYNAKKATFRTWLYRIASNKLTDYWRKRALIQNICRPKLMEGGDEDIGGKEEKDILTRLVEQETLREVMELVYSFDSS